jgi:hypothetical protein
LIKCPLFLNFILTYLKSSISSHFRKTVSLQTFTFGVPVSDVTIKVGYSFLKAVHLKYYHVVMCVHLQQY